MEKNKQVNDRKLWTKQEDLVISTLISKYGTSHWTLVATQMKKICQKSIRSSKQIRERWHNHLSPSINKSEWTEEEEEIIFSYHKKFGNKWKDIALKLNNRTDNAIKNHFYSTIRRSLRRVNKCFGYKDSTKIMRGFKPAVLSFLVETSHTNEQFKNIIDIIFKFSQKKPTKNNQPIITTDIANVKEVYEHILKIIKQFSENHSKNKREAIKKLKKTKNIESSQIQIDNIEVLNLDNIQCNLQNSSTLSHRQCMLENYREHTTDINNEISEDQEQFQNYFGNKIQTKTWFNVNQNDEYLEIKGLDQIDKHLEIYHEKLFSKPLNAQEQIQQEFV